MSLFLPKKLCFVKGRLHQKLLKKKAIIKVKCENMQDDNKQFRSYEKHNFCAFFQHFFIAESAFKERQDCFKDSRELEFLVIRI